MNPAGRNHAGRAPRACVLALPFPYVEVPGTNLEKRDIPAVPAPAAAGGVHGFGVHWYVLGLVATLMLPRKESPAAR
jgi:3-dehydroquinate dehydratase